MGLKMHEVARGEATTEFEWNGSIVHITFNPNAYTPQAEAEWKAVAEKTLGSEVAIDFVKSLIRKWDLMGDVVFETDEMDNRISGTGKLIDSDSMFPLDDREKLMYVPIEFLSEVVDAVQLEMVVGKENRRRSKGGSNMAEIRRIPT